MDATSRFSLFFLKVKQWLRHLTFKKIALFIACAILVLLPTILACFYAYYTDHVYRVNHFSVTLYDESGAELVSQEGIPENATPRSALDLFYQLHTKKEPISNQNELPSLDRYVSAKTNLNGTSLQLKCYFTTEHSQGYCIDQNGTLYTIPTQINQRFLETEYGESFYSNAIPPQLLTIDNDSILPSKIEWNYQTLEENYLPALKNPTTQEHHLYEITGALDISFEKKPDYCLIKVYQGTELLAQSNLDELASLPVDTGNRLRLEVQATWKQANNTQAYGTLNYAFDVQIRNPSVFSVDTASVPAGGFAQISCSNITNLSKIKFTSDAPELSPRFYLSGDSAFALLAIPQEMDAKEIHCSVSYGASEHSFTISVTQPKEILYEKPLWENQDPSALHADAKKEFDSILASMSETNENAVYFRGNFQDPLQNQFAIGYTHGATLQWGADADEVLTTIGAEFITENGQDASVTAWNHGIVLSIGSCDLLGNYVVVDHGCGLKLWYGHLSTVNVAAGDAVIAGQTIGITGTGGISTANGFLVICTVQNTVIDPFHLQGKELFQF